MPESHVLPRSSFDRRAFQDALLTWYGKNRRILPWRSGPGEAADPYHVWLSEIMLQQTTVPAVIPYFLKFTERWPSVHDLAAAPSDDVMQAWAGLGYYARARNLLKCAVTVAETHKGAFPDHEEGLLELPGIGPYTSAAIAAIAFGKQATVVDGNIERVAARVFAITEPLPASKKQVKAAAHTLFQDVAAPGDFAQGLMDLGAGICTPQSPKCGLCPVSAMCEARARGIQSQIPAKAPKKPRPQRTGTVYWLTTGDGSIVTERRAEHRMLGGMPGLPTTDWDAAGEGFEPGAAIRSKLRPGGQIHHTFTHFDLTLEIVEGEVSMEDLPAKTVWKSVPRSAIKDTGFPGLFKKVVKFKTASADVL